MSDKHIDIDNLATLARIDMSAEEKESIRKDIESILSYVTQIQEIQTDTQDSEIGGIHNVFRSDEIAFEPEIFTKDIMNEAPMIEKTNGGVYVKVKKIL